MKVKSTNRKISVIVIIIIAVFIIRLSFSFMGLQDQISVLTNENAELQDGLTSLPFVQVGRNFLDGLDKTPGKILSIHLEEKAPVSWQNYTEIDKARVDETGEILHPYVVGEPRLCWVIQFEQAKHPSRSFEVWVDIGESQVVGWAESC